MMEGGAGGEREDGQRVVMSDIADAPVGCGPNPRLVEAAFLDQVRPHAARHRRFTGDPGKALSRRQDEIGDDPFSAGVPPAR